MRGRRGFVLVTMVVSAVAVLACVGLAVDTGYLQLVKSRMQTAADAAAMGGVQEIKQNGPSHAVEAAMADSALNGFTNGVSSVSVTVNNPPATGFYTSDPTAMEVIVSQNVGTLFMSVLGFTSVRVRARSVARQGAGSSCLYTLDRNANNAFAASGGVNVVVNCGIVVNSDSDRALTASGGAHVTATSISVAGDYASSGGAVLSPAPVTGVEPENDPLAYLTPPPVGSWDHPSKTDISGGAVTTLHPGVYCKGIGISGGSRVTFEPGTYILLGGGLNISGGSIVSGTGVTFYNTFASGKPYGAISISGGTTVTFSAPTTGSLAGILFYQDPAAGNGPPNTLSGGASSVFNGALYFPTTELSYSGGSAGNYTIIVSKTISFSGGSTLNANYSSLPGGSPVKGSAALSE